MKHAVSFSILLVGLLAIGCAGHSASPLSQSAREPGVTYFVENHGSDQRNLEQLIAGVLASKGLQVTAGPRAARPQNVTYIVSYVDRWRWDLRTYLARITIKVREPGSRTDVATSVRHQDSLAAMGISYEEIIESAAAALLLDTP